MKSKVVEDANVVTHVVVCDPGEEGVAALARSARSEQLEAAQIIAIGAFERATVGWFDRATRAVCAIRTPCCWMSRLRALTPRLPSACSPAFVSFFA